MPANAELDALTELVALKELKDALPSLTHDLAAWGVCNADYLRRKPVAWQKAKDALKAANSNSTTP